MSAILPSAWRALGLNISVHSCLKVLGSTWPPAEPLLRTPQQRPRVQGAVCCYSLGLRSGDALHLREQTGMMDGNITL